MKRKIFQIVSATALTLLCTAQMSFADVVSVGPYKDIDFRHSASKQAYVLHKTNLMPGLKDDHFGGKFKLTRFQYADILNRLIGRREVANVMVIVFHDINSKNKYYEAVSKITRAGLLKVDSGSFDGRKSVTRYEFAKGIDKMLKMLDAEPPIPRDNPIVVTDVGQEYSSSVNEVLNNWQLTDAYADKTFRGFNDITRYEALEMVANAAKLVSEEVRIAMKEAMPEPPLQALVSPTKVKTTQIAEKTDTYKELEQLINKTSIVAKSEAKPKPAPVQSHSPSLSELAKTLDSINTSQSEPERPEVVKTEPVKIIPEVKSTPVPAKIEVIQTQAIPEKQETKELSLKELADQLNNLSGKTQAESLLVEQPEKVKAANQNKSAVISLEQFALKLNKLPQKKDISQTKIAKKVVPVVKTKDQSNSLEALAQKLKHLSQNTGPVQKIKTASHPKGMTLEDFATKLQTLSPKAKKELVNSTPTKALGTITPQSLEALAQKLETLGKIK